MKSEEELHQWLDIEVCKLSQLKNSKEREVVQQRIGLLKCILEVD